MFQKLRRTAILALCAMMFSVVQPAFADYRTGSAGGDAAAYGTAGAIIAGGILTFITGGLALPLLGAAAAGGAAGYYGYKEEDKSLGKDVLAVGGSVAAGVLGAGAVGAVAEGVGALVGGGAAATAGTATTTATTAGTAGTAGTVATTTTAGKVIAGGAGAVGALNEASKRSSRGSGGYPGGSRTYTGDGGSKTNSGYNNNYSNSTNAYNYNNVGKTSTSGKVSPGGIVTYTNTNFGSTAPVQGKHTPIGGNGSGHWLGDRGYSEYVLNTSYVPANTKMNPDGLSIGQMAEKAKNDWGLNPQTAIPFENGVPRFDKAGWVITSVKVPNLTEIRAKNFAEADELLAKELYFQKLGFTAKDIARFRQEEGLTWHECGDSQRGVLQLIPTEIHNAVVHSGGISEMKSR